MLMTLLAVVLMAGGGLGLENGLARTPPMGWISWAKFFCEDDCVRHPLTCISERLYMDMANALVAGGYREAGYVQVNIDDCWMEHNRDRNGRLVANRTRFSHGIKWLSAYDEGFEMHQRGLKLGIYGDFGTYTCAGYPGSLGHIKTDAQTFADWDIDMLKFDGCNVNVSLNSWGYPEMARQLNATGKRILYSIEWPLYSFWVNGRRNGTLAEYREIAKWGNMFRNWADVAVNWRSIASVIQYFVSQQDVFIRVNGPGHWNDPDMIVVGNPELSIDQSEAQMAIWSIWSAPLFMSNDLRWMPPGYPQHSSH